MGKNLSRRSILKAGSVLGFGALAACDEVEFPGFERPQTTEACADTNPAGQTENASSQSAAPASVEPPRQATSAAGYRYEVERTDAEWRALLSEADYKVLREGGTEPRNSSPLATETRPGTYACKGCALPTYSSSRKIILPQGWVFFEHSYPDAVLTGIDQEQIETHCRRCGSHLGHVLFVDGGIVHCINGSALTFTAIG